MENNKVFNIKGLYSLSTFELLSKAVVTFLFILLTISVATTDGLAITCITLIICVILLVALYCSYKNYVDFGKTGIIVDIENNKFVYPVKITVYNLNEKSIQEIHLSSIFAISAKDNVIRKSDGKLRYYYNISIQSNEIDYPINYSFYSSGNRDRLYSILKSVNRLGE